jgi:hypothetical protein
MTHLFLHSVGHPVPGGYKYENLALQVGGVSDETVKYVYGSWATRTIEWLHCKLQIRPLVREGAPQKQDHKFQTATFRQEVISSRKSQSGLDTKTYWLTVSRKVTSTFDLFSIVLNPYPWNNTWAGSKPAPSKSFKIQRILTMFAAL